MNHIGPHTNTGANSNKANLDSNSNAKAGGALSALASGKQAPITPAKRNHGESVQLSSQAVDLSTLEQAAQQAPDFNASKVMSLHNRIAAGNYPIDSGSIAAKMLAFDDLIDD